MKFTINKDDIIDILAKIQGITGRKSNLAITANVFIQTAENEIRIAATDLETGFEGFYPAHVESHGRVAVNSRKLYEILKEFPSDTISIHEIENRWIEIKNPSIEFHIVGMNPDDYPAIPQAENVPFLEIPSDTFKQMIEKSVIIQPAGSDEKRAHIIGVNFERTEKDGNMLVRMVSTDGRRLNKYDALDAASVAPADNILIPKKGLQEVNKFLPAGGMVQVGIQDNHFVVKIGHETVIINLLEGEFPEYEEIFNVNPENNIEIERHPFIRMLKRMSILSTESYKSVIFNFDIDQLSISASNPEMGESREDMPLAFNREPIEVAFNPKYFLDTLTGISDDTVVMNIRDRETACMITGKDNDQFVSIIMPMKI